MQRHYESLQISFEVRLCAFNWLTCCYRSSCGCEQSMLSHLSIPAWEKKSVRTDRKGRKILIGCNVRQISSFTWPSRTAPMLPFYVFLLSLSLSLSPQRILCARTWVCLHAQAADGSKVELFWLVSERACSSQGPLAEERAHTLTHTLTLPHTPRSCSPLLYFLK